MKVYHCKNQGATTFDFQIRMVKLQVQIRAEQPSHSWRKRSGRLRRHLPAKLPAREEGRHTVDGERKNRVVADRLLVMNFDSESRRTDTEN